MSDANEPQLDELRRRARRRLIGAVVLALAAAVLVPMLLESDPKPLGEDVSVKIPPVDDGKFVSKLGDKNRVADRAPPESSKPGPAPTSPDAATVAAAKDASKSGAAPSTVTKKPPADVAPTGPAALPKSPVVPPVKDSSPADAPNVAPGGASPVSKPASDAVSAMPTDAAKAAKPPAGAFSVQLAAFADDKGANALANRLKQAGHPAYTEAYSTSRGTLWRVRVGPYGTRDAAEAARTKLKADGQNGIIATAN